MDERLKRICKNYNVIVNCEFLEDDIFSQNLVASYKDIVSKVSLEDMEALSKLAKFDYVMRKYIEDYDFSRRIKESIDVTELLNYNGDISLPLLEYVSQFSEIYDNEKNEVITNTKWI